MARWMVAIDSPTCPCSRARSRKRAGRFCQECGIAYAPSYSQSYHDTLGSALMNKGEPGRLALWLSFPLAVFLAAASLGGLFLSSTYAEETRLRAAQSVGNDAG